ncbi:50S ribosomal protein L24 [Acidihalobacter prosperus]
MQRIRKDDDVMVIAGKDKGRRGKVKRILSQDKLVVENVNMIKKHQRGNPQAGTQGGIIEREAAIHASNVMLYNPATGKGDRIGYRTLEDGRKVRYFKSNNEVVDA